MYVWGLREEYISPNKIIESSKTLCWSAKWLGDKKVMHDSIYKSSEKKMLKGIHALLDEADVVIHYNGLSFDVPTLNKDFLLHKMTPPAPYKQVDLLQVSRKTFRFQSHKLDYVLKMLEHGGKVKHEGFQLWISCENLDPKAWKVMEKYNKGDVDGLEKVYYDFRPWIKNHPNQNLYSEVQGCPACGGKHFQRRSQVPSGGKMRQRLQCVTRGPNGRVCGKWFQGPAVEPSKKVLYKGIA